MTELEFDRIRKFMKNKYGIDLNRKKTIVEGRLSMTISKGGYKDYTQYLDAVKNDSTGEMEKELVNILTTNHTYFMREFEHFDYFRKVILPYFKETERLSKDLRIWCGASSTGEEPYMIAMTIMDFFGLEHRDWDTKVLATDISTEALQKAMRGEYSEEAVSELTENWRRRFVKPSGEPGMYCMSDELKNEVIFRQFNLMNEFPFRKPMHVIFLRNVMIYFDQATKNDLIKRAYDCLVPGGYLIVGLTESVDTTVIPFKMVSSSVFRKPI